MTREGIKMSLSGKLMTFLMTKDQDDRWVTIAKCTGLLLVAPIGLIEGIVRGALALLATPVALFLPEGKMREWYDKHIFSPLAQGSMLSFLAFIMALCTPSAVLIGGLSDMMRMPPSIWCCCTQSPSDPLYET